MKEKRTSKRLQINLSATYKLSATEDISHATILNISFAGFCFLADQPIDPGTIVELAIELGPDSTVNIIGETVWNKELEGTDEFTNGVKILDKTDQAERDKFSDFYGKILFYPPEA